MAFFPESALSPQSPAAVRLVELYGFVPRVFRLLGPLPDVVTRQTALLHALLANEQHLSRVQKEQVLLAVSSARRSDYGVALHRQVLALLGVPESQIAEISSVGQLDGPDGALVAAVRKLMLQPMEFAEEDIDRLRRAGFSEEQIVEVIVLTGTCDFLNTVQFGLGALPDFASPPLPSAAAPKKLHPEPPEVRPTYEEAPEDPDAGEVVRAQSGDLAAFEALVERHSQRIYRTLIGLLGNPEDAKDALQDTFLKAFQNLARFERRSRFSTWLVTIASNTGLQRLRERRNIESLDDDTSDGEEFRPKQVRAWGDDPEQMYSKTQRRELLERAIARLPAKYRVAIMLRDVQQISTEEAAASLGLGVPALKARVLRGRLMLREHLAPHLSEGAHSA